MTSGTQSHPQSPSQSRAENAGNGHAGADDAAVRSLDDVLRTQELVKVAISRNVEIKPYGIASALWRLANIGVFAAGLWRLGARGDVTGTIDVADAEATWRFTPQQPWPAGGYRLVVDNALEDVAGNLTFAGTPFSGAATTVLTVTLTISDGTVTGNAGTGTVCLTVEVLLVHVICEKQIILETIRTQEGTISTHHPLVDVMLGLS